MYNKVKALCDKHGISIYQLEKRLGFANGLVAKWKESSPSVEKAKLIADYFGITVDELIKEARKEK